MRPLDIRCDGGTDIGMGHVVRCVALAEMLRDEFNIEFIIQETDQSVYSFIRDFGYQVHTISRTSDPSEDAMNTLNKLRKGSVVLLDGYNFKTSYQEAIRNDHHKLAVIDDLHAWFHVADIVINHAPGVQPINYQAASYTRLLLGCEYALIRKEFYTYQSSSRERKIISDVVISMGASDLHNVTLKFAEVLLTIPRIQSINILLSDLNPHKKDIIALRSHYPEKIHIHQDLRATDLSALIYHNDMMICPSSTISLETCCVGTTLVTGYTAANQMDILNGINSLDLGYDLGNLTEISKEQIHDRLASIISNPELNNLKRMQQKKIFDHHPKMAFEQAFGAL
jgi:UDP-2,4-diacetamido-2,4,6-trideoxy-beta-L-altropyranose hydrolase